MRHIIMQWLLLFLCVVPPAAAQDRDTVFLHGLRSDPSQWNAAVGHLAPQLAIRPYQPALDWRAFFEVQAAALEHDLAGQLSGDVIAVAHSNGGVVARQWTKNRDLRSLITLGSPNQNAPLANHIFEWLRFLDDVFVRVSNVNTVYAKGVDHDVWWWLPAQWIPRFNAAFDVWNTANNGPVALGFDVSMPVMPEMRVASSYMSSLNSLSNLNREAAEIRDRVAIVSVPADFDHGGPFRVIDPGNYEAWHNGLNITGIALDGLAGIVRILAEPSDQGAFDLADQISSVAEWFLQFEEIWCRSVSDPSPYALGRCYEHDGVVPAWSQTYDYPRVPFILELNGPVHTHEMAESDDQLFQALTTVAHVELRDGGQPPAISPPPVPTPLHGRFKVDGGEAAIGIPTIRGRISARRPRPSWGASKSTAVARATGNRTTVARISVCHDAPGAGVGGGRWPRRDGGLVVCRSAAGTASHACALCAVERGGGRTWPPGSRFGDRVLSVQASCRLCARCGDWSSDLEAEHGGARRQHTRLRRRHRRLGHRCRRLQPGGVRSLDGRTAMAFCPGPRIRAGNLSWRIGWRSGACRIAGRQALLDRRGVRQRCLDNDGGGRPGSDGLPARHRRPCGGGRLHRVRITAHRRVALLDLATGRQVWRTAFPRAVDPLLGTGSTGGPIIADRVVVASSGNGTVYGFDRTSGSIVWTVPSIDTIPTIIRGPLALPETSTGPDYRPLARSGQIVIVGSLKGDVVAYDLATRQERWRYLDASNGSVAFAIASDDQSVYVPFVSGRHVALALSNGAERWRTSNAADGFSWPSASDGTRIFMAGDKGGFIAIRR